VVVPSGVVVQRRSQKNDPAKIIVNPRQYATSEVLLCRLCIHLLDRVSDVMSRTAITEIAADCWSRPQRLELGTSSMYG
jgi:hypothetical protein